MPVRFDADGDYLQRTGNGIPPSAFTVGGWILQVNDRAANRVLHLNTNGSTAYIGLGMNAADALWVYSSTAAGGTTGSTITAGVWHHVMLVKNGTSYVVYLDGVSDITWTNTVTFTSAGFLFGQPGYLFDGQLSHWRVWTAALSQAEVQAERSSATAVRTANLHAAYEFTSSTTADTGGNSYTLTANGTPTLAGAEPFIVGTSSVTLDAVTLVSAGTVETPAGDITGALSATLGAVVSSSAGVVAVVGTASNTLAALTLSAVGGINPSVPRFSDSFLTLDADTWDLAYSAGAGYRTATIADGVTVCELGITDAASSSAYSDCDTHELTTPNSPTNTVFEARLRASHDFETGGHGTQGWGLYNGSTTSYSFAWFWVGCDHNVAEERLGLRLHVYQDNVQLYDQPLTGWDVTQWHTYRVECRSTGVRFFIDNTLVGETTSALSDALRADVWVDNQYNNGTTQWYDITEGQWIQWSWINLYDVADWTGISAGDPAVHGVVSSILAAATLSAAGTNAVEGEATQTLAALTASGAGTVSIAGQLASTLDALTVLSAGTVEWLPISGELSATLGALVSVSAGVVAIVGQVSATLDAVALVGSGDVSIAGQTSVTLGDLALVSAGVIGNPPITGALSVTLDALAVVSAGLVPVVGQGSSTLGALTAQSSGTVMVYAVASVTLDALALSAAGVIGDVPVIGSLAQTLEPLAASSAGVVAVTGASVQTLSPLTSSSAGTVSVSGALSVTLGALALNATGATLPAIVGSLNVTLGALILVATGGLDITAPETSILYIPLGNRVITVASGTRTIYVPRNR